MPGTGIAIRNNSTGQIRISQADLLVGTYIESANEAAIQGTILLAANGIAAWPRLVMSGGTVRNVASDSVDPVTDARAINNLSAGGITISNGTVSVTDGVAIRNANSGAITIRAANGFSVPMITSANTSLAQGTIVLEDDNGNGIGGTRLTLDGGEVANTANVDTARTINNLSRGDVIIERGIVRAGAGVAIINVNGGLIRIDQRTHSIADRTIISSANDSSAHGTIVLGHTLTDDGPGPGGRLTMLAGLISAHTNGATVNAITNNSTGSIVIEGGTVEGNLGVAINNLHAGTITVLQGGRLFFPTVITSRNTGSGAGTIFVGQPAGTEQWEWTNERISIQGGTVENSGGVHSPRWAVFIDCRFAIDPPDIRPAANVGAVRRFPHPPSP